MTGQHYIDGKDMYSTFGVVVLSGSDDFLKFPARKASISHDWGDKNGIDVDLSKPFVEAKNVTLQCAMIAADKATFWVNHAAFFAELMKPGTRRLEVAAFEKSFYVYYRDCSSFDRFSKMNNGKIVCRFTLSVTEQEPDFSGGDGVYWVDDEGQFVIL